MMPRRPEMTVALVGLSWPGYRSLALGYVRAYAQADRRLAGRVGFTTLELASDDDAWWVAYRVLALAPDVVGFSVTCYNARVVYDAARIIGTARPETRIVLGGPEVGPIAEEVLADNPDVTAVVRGEGEKTFAELLLALLEGRDAASVAGVTARTRGAITSAPDRPEIEDLDTVPSPYLTGLLEAVDGATYLEGYRGCPHRCGYCYEGKGSGKVRAFSPARIAAEIAHVASTPGVSSFSFIDPVFNLTPARLEWLSDTLAPLAARGMRLHTIEVDIERVDDEAARRLARAGVASVETGPQSIGTSALATCRRSFDRDRFVAGVEACRRAGIRVECDLIVGLPGDTVEDFLDGMRFALSVDPGVIQFSTLHVLPGTDLWGRADELGLRFNQAPPHEIIRTREIGFTDLRRAEILGSAVTRIYRARVARAVRPPEEGTL